jgi:hypothetical protein
VCYFVKEFGEDGDGGAAGVSGLLYPVLLEWDSQQHLAFHAIRARLFSSRPSDQCDEEGRREWYACAEPGCSWCGGGFLIPTYVILNGHLGIYGEFWICMVGLDIGNTFGNCMCIGWIMASLIYYVRYDVKDIGTSTLCNVCVGGEEYIFTLLYFTTLLSSVMFIY